MPLYPIFADLRSVPVLVVGGGAVAARKVAGLLDAGAQVTVNAPVLHPELGAWREIGRIAHRSCAFDQAMLAGTWLVIAATSSRTLNRHVAELAGARRIFANVVDDPGLSRFHVPAVIDRTPLTIAISSGGHAPMLARWLRERLETLLEPSLGALAELIGRWRGRINRTLPAGHRRRSFYTRLLDGPVAALVRRGRLSEADRAADAALRGVSIDAGNGSVVLVGAGPGDPGLLTLAGLRALNEADVILHDRLVSGEVLALARRDAERIEVGKQPGDHHTAQQRIHALMLAHARRGRRVVRLKGGDPFVFGRGGEELEYLRAHGIAYEVVPGITAAAACAAYAGVPLTHRDHAQSVRLVTAHCRASLDTLDWGALAQDRQTLAVYMGVGELGCLRDRLIAHGRARSTPFALVENGSRPGQRVVTGTLERLPEIALGQAVRSPALLILGEVAALADRLAWFGPPPLGQPHGPLRGAGPCAAAADAACSA